MDLITLALVLVPDRSRSLRHSDGQPAGRERGGQGVGGRVILSLWQWQLQAEEQFVDSSRSCWWAGSAVRS